MRTPKTPLKSTTIALLLGTAVFFDLLQILLALIFMDWLVTIFAYMTFWLWFFLLKIRLLTPKRIAITGGTLFLEIFPFVAALPAITAMVALTIFSTKAEELTHNRG